MFGYGYAFPAPVLTSEETRDAANDARIAAVLDAEDALVEPPRQLNVPQPAAVAPAPSLGQPDRAAIREAAFRASRLFPGPIGACLSSELLTWEEFGYRLDGHGHAARLIAAVMDWPSPDDDLTPAA